MTLEEAANIAEGVIELMVGDGGGWSDDQIDAIERLVDYSRVPNDA